MVNDRIHFKEVLLIGPDGESFGVVPLRVALQKSMDMQLDLYCVSPQAHPPVCKIINYGKFKFEKGKKEREAKKNQKKTVIKEIRFTATTDKHDLETKAKAAIKFLGEGMKVKVAVFIKGRMMQRMDIVKQTLQDFLEMVKGYDKPVLLIHGTGDVDIPVESAYALKKVYGDSCELDIVEGANHRFLSLPWKKHAYEKTLEFLKNQLD